jgi:hypothetical protein
MGYAAAVAIVACPFCREMFEEGEATACPICGVGLKALEKLPPSHDALAEDPGIPLAPEQELLPASYLGRNKGLLSLAGLLGIALFFLPWVHVTLPDLYTFSGFDLARRLGWSWAAGVAWVVLLPTVMSRRTIMQLRGARVAAAFLSAIPAVTIAVLLARPPHGGLVPVRFTYDWPLFATLVVSIVATALAIGLGGRLDDIEVARGTSRGQDLH